MAVDHFRYDLLAQHALRGVVRQVLADVAKKGLPGEHHFYITFDTTAPGVRISERLRAQYPREITIVLQHQFWDLVVSDEAFEVGLSFKGVPERVTVPFAAIKGFIDPSVQFGLQFETAAPGEGRPESPQGGEEPEAKTRRQHAQPSSEATHLPAPLPAEPAGAEQTAASAKKPAQPAGGAEVVRLDRFRKK
jgi:hypothetical protein